MNIAILLMAGLSRRFDQSKKKQFYEIKGTPSFIYPLTALNDAKNIQEIYIVANPTDEKQLQSILKGYKFTKLKGIVKGGIARQDSVFNALRYINQIHPNCENVLIHDSARILVTSEIIDKLCDEADKHKFVVCATHENDSIATVTQNNIIKYQPRRTVHRILTPQCFQFEKLFEVYQQAFEENYKGSNDDAAILLNYGYKIKTMIVDDSLIKLTYFKDVKIVNYLIDGGILKNGSNQNTSKRKKK